MSPCKYGGWEGMLICMFYLDVTKYLQLCLSYSHIDIFWYNLTNLLPIQQGCITSSNQIFPSKVKVISRAFTCLELMSVFWQNKISFRMLLTKNKTCILLLRWIFMHIQIQQVLFRWCEQGRVDSEIGGGSTSIYQSNCSSDWKRAGQICVHGNVTLCNCHRYLSR